jgi:hypothetical protein
MKWELRVRPPSNVCPEHYCFHWAGAGDRTSQPGRTCVSREEALRELRTWKVWEVGGCACSFGPCRRINSAAEVDYYEPCEPRLEQDGLPRFYFITLASLRPEFHEQFINEATDLWGEAALVELTDPPFFPPDGAAGEQQEPE